MTDKTDKTETDQAFEAEVETLADYVKRTEGDVWYSVRADDPAGFQRACKVVDALPVEARERVLLCVMTPIDRRYWAKPRPTLEQMVKLLEGSEQRIRELTEERNEARRERNELHSAMFPEVDPCDE